jgi:hypothetical protein
MNTLAKRTIEAHGGIKRWNELTSVTAHLDEDGALWGLKGHPEMLGETNVTVGTRSEWASHHPFLTDRARTRFEPPRVALESENGELIEELKEPRASFAGHGLETPWSKLQLAYFAGYAMWTYLNLPFLLARPDVASEEGTPWEEDGETWRRLQIRFPASIATHSTNQTLYFNSEGLLKRHDYDVDISGGTQAAHYTGEYLEAGGIMFPTKHVIFPRQPDNTPNRDLLVVSIGMSNFALK